MMNWENRKKSEEWVKHKSEEYSKADSDLTFAEWCYQQGKADTIEEYGIDHDSILAQRIIDEASILFKETADPVVFHEVLWERVIPIAMENGKEQK